MFGGMEKRTVTACWMDFLPAALLIICAGMRQLLKRARIKVAQRETELGIKRTQERIDALPTYLPHLSSIFRNSSLSKFIISGKSPSVSITVEEEKAK